MQPETEHISARLEVRRSGHKIKIQICVVFREPIGVADIRFSFDRSSPPVFMRSAVDHAVALGPDRRSRLAVHSKAEEHAD